MADLTFKNQGGIVVRQIERAASDTIAALANLPTSILSDCLDRANVFDSALVPIGPVQRFAGSAVTVEEIEGGNLMSHLATKYLEPGDVLVIDGKGVTRRACWGGLQTEAAHRRGCRGMVIDGAIRDRDDVARLGIPLYCRGSSPAGPHKGGAGRVNVAISCGSVVVQPGDVIVGDSDGVVVVPRARAASIVAIAQAKLLKEAAWFEQVAQGQIPADFLGLTDKIREFGIEII